jgi:hypothetical protein
MEFFSLFYQLNVYGQDLFYHLKGWDNGMQDFVAANNQFPTIWLVTFFSALLVFVVYYYILNHPRFNKVWHWLITMAVLAIGIFIWSRGLVMSDIAGVSLHPVDPALNVSADNALMFGVYNAVLSAIFFLFFSIVGRFGSKNCKNSPWKSLINRK